MSQEQNKISDLIDGGLKNRQDSIRIDYAIYSKIIDQNPLIRFGTLQEAKDEFINSNDYTLIIAEVSEIRNGKRIITTERVVKAPMMWLPANKYLPAFDDNYLCHLVRKEECGNFIKWQQVLNFKYGNWQISGECRVTHWMIVEDPINKLKLL